MARGGVRATTSDEACQWWIRQVLLHVANTCFNCFRCFERMFQAFHVDVARCWMCPRRSRALPLSPISCQRRGQSAMEQEELCSKAYGARPWTGHQDTDGSRALLPRSQRAGVLSRGWELEGDAAGRRSPRVHLRRPTKKARVASIAESWQVFLCCKCMFRVFLRLLSNVASYFILTLQK
jgi:hypothetical protein